MNFLRRLFRRNPLTQPYEMDFEKYTEYGLKYAGPPSRGVYAEWRFHVKKGTKLTPACAASMIRSFSSAVMSEIQP